MSGTAAPPGEGAKRLLGSWRYLKTVDNGTTRDRGANPSGIIYYGPHGEMCVHIAPDRPRPRAGGVATPEECRNAIEGYIGYFGTYSVDERTGIVTHHRQVSIQPGDGGDLSRRYEFVGDRLILRPLNAVGMEVHWERIK